MRNNLRRFGKLLKLVQNPTYRHGLSAGVAAAIEHEGALRPLAVGAVIDVGANRGQFSLLAKSLYGTCDIYAFEPLHGAAQRYRTIFSKDERVHLYPVAAGDSAGTAAINVSGHADSSSLLPISDRQNQIFPGTAAVASEEIQVERVDDVLRDTPLAEPILIKLDVQGYELAALKGMPRLLEKARYVYVEVSFEELYEGQPLAPEIIEWLAGHGFRLAGMYNVSFTKDGVAVQADALFKR